MYETQESLLLEHISITNTVVLTTTAVKPRASKREIATSSDRSKVLLIL